MPYHHARAIIVIGLGNVLMSDEGVGVYVVRELMESRKKFPSVDFLELGSSVMSAVHAIAFRRSAIFVDCARMNEKPGTIRRFTPDDVVSLRTEASLSSHGTGLLRILEVSREFGESPQSVTIFGIQPQRIAPGELLSDKLQSCMNYYVETVKSELVRGDNHV